MIEVQELQRKLEHIHPLSRINTAYWLHKHAEVIFEREGEGGFCIEIGTWVGFTGIAMALAGVHVHAIDTFDARDQFTGPRRVAELKSFMKLSAAVDVDMFEVFVENCEKAGVDTITGFQIESLEAARRYHPEMADLIFIDADHSGKAILADLEAWPRVLKHGGLLVVDNYDGIITVKLAFDNFLDAHGWPPAQHAADVMWFSTKPRKGAAMPKPENEQTPEVEPSMDAVSESLAAPPTFVIGGIGGMDKQAVAEAIIAEATELDRLESLMYLCHEILARLPK